MASRQQFAALVGLLAVGSGGWQSPDSTRGIVNAASAYVAEYQRQLTAIVADEVYSQQVAEQAPRDPKMPRTRVTRSEVFFMYAATNRHWMAIRDVMTVDGAAVPDRPDFREALKTLAPDVVAARFREYNSRYNIGRTFRNFNEPTMALLVLDEHHRGRFSFDRKRVERTGDTPLVTIAFTEKESPTLIFDVRRGKVFSTGELVVEAGTGRVRQTTLRAKIDALRLELTTTYAPDERLGMWVPTVFRENYEYGAEWKSKMMDAPADYERVIGAANYSNFRRFETSVRIK